MAIHVVWDNEEKTVVRWDFEGIWDWQEVYYAAGRSATMREAVDHAVSVILNLERATPLKSGALTHTKNALSFKPENRDLVVVVGQSHFVQSMVDIFRTMNPGYTDSFVGADTLNAARRLIRLRQEGRD
ncbi:MAG: hypothetical protein MUF87_14870 [Anaerolineae bacterium]|jgi:microcystin degradation protein MlrC|nr:hypothetical protein [Anaerolineae bacterium]